MRTRLAITLLAALAALGSLGACAPRASDLPYPPQPDPAQEAVQRRDFVDSFLQGRWCEARVLYEDAVDGAVRRDALCEAAATARLAARMKAYLGLPAPEEERAAKDYLRAGLDCPGFEAPPARDEALTALLAAGDWAGLLRAVRAEKDGLYASVYARKGALAALEAGHGEDALALVEAARAVDARQGWVAFLRQDWAIRLRLETDEDTRRAIRERIELLGSRIEPCP